MSAPIKTSQKTKATPVHCLTDKSVGALERAYASDTWSKCVSERAGMSSLRCDETSTHCDRPTPNGDVWRYLAFARSPRILRLHPCLKDDENPKWGSSKSAAR